MAEPAAQISAESAATGEGAEGEKVVGRPFEAGKSGNPGGRPKGLARTVREVLGRAVEEGEDASLILVQFWAGVLADPKAKMEHRLQAADRLADRGWGKAPQFAPVEVDDPLGMAEEQIAAAAADLDAEVDEVGAKRREREEREEAMVAASALEPAPAVE